MEHNHSDARTDASTPLMRRQFLKTAGVVSTGVAFEIAGSSAMQGRSIGQAAAGRASAGASQNANATADESRQSESGSGEIPRRPLGRAGVQVCALGSAAITSGI